MTASPPPPEIAFLASPLGGAITITIALTAFAATWFWARRPGRPDRWAAVLAAAGTSLLMALITLVAVVAGWWRGAFLDIALLVGLAIYFPFSVAGYTLWLGVYRWLAPKVRRPLLTYAAAVLVFIPVVLIVDPIQMGRGQFEIGGGYTVWIDALLGQVVMLSPAIFYEFFRRKLGRAIPSAV